MILTMQLWKIFYWQRGRGIGRYEGIVVSERLFQAGAPAEASHGLMHIKQWDRFVSDVRYQKNYAGPICFPVLLSDDSFQLPISTVIQTVFSEQIVL